MSTECRLRDESALRSIDSVRTEKSVNRKFGPIQSGEYKLIRVFVFLGALTAAGTAAYVASNMTAPPPPVQVAAPVVPQIETEQVLVLARDMKIGDKLEEAALQWQEWPSRAVNASFVTKSASPDALSKFNGRVVTVALNTGQPLSMRSLHDGKNAFLAGTLRSGMRAYSVSISPETGAGGFILPQDRVDVVLTREENPTDDQQRPSYVSETVLTNIKVLAIDQITDRHKSKERVAIGKTATLEVDPRQAQHLAVSEKLGTIALMLRSVADAHQNGERYDDGATVAMRVHSTQNGEVKVSNYTVNVDRTSYDTQRIAASKDSWLSLD